MQIDEDTTKKISTTEVSICKVRSVCGEQVELEVFKKNKGSFQGTGQVVNVDIKSCFPSGFKLTNSNNVPAKIKERISQEKLSIA